MSADEAPYCNVEESQNLLEIHLQADPSNKAALNTDPGDLNLSRIAERAANYDGKENEQPIKIYANVDLPPLSSTSIEQNSFAEVLKQAKAQAEVPKDNRRVTNLDCKWQPQNFPCKIRSIQVH